jgi:hypothetical protein
MRVIRWDAIKQATNLRQEPLKGLALPVRDPFLLLLSFTVIWRRS